ncbi:MAG: sodium:pantothenate symporter [Pseudomonadota bacterium]
MTILGMEFAPLLVWGWFFLVLYIAVMLVFGVVGMARVKNSDDFATARGAYGPVFLAFAMTATAASGATFLGLPALAYEAGLSSLWYAFVYPLGIYIGVLVCLVIIRRAGDNFGSRSIPEYLGDRFDSDLLRLLAAIFSILLLFYLAGQLLSGAVMFFNFLGLETLTALLVTAAILMFYVTLGGAHADILTDGIQGALMLALAIFVLFMFLIGFGIDGGLSGVLRKLNEIDPALTTPFNEDNPLFDSWWDLFAIFCAHLPLGLLPHIGNKLWALRSKEDQRRFITLSFICGLLLPAITCGGILARALLGDDLLVEGNSPNNAIPALFIATLPTWIAALIGAGVLSAVMSTADGLVVSSAQIFANDIYRRTIAPRGRARHDPARIDATALTISRIATVMVLLCAVAIAWFTRDMNIALLVWTGVGGMMAASAGPLFLGALWRRSTRAGAVTSFVVGGVTFILLKAGAIQGQWFNDGPLQSAGVWLESQAINPFACATLGSAAGIVAMVLVSLASQPLDETHLKRVFGDR